MRILSILILLFSLSCSASKNNRKSIDSTKEISLERTACYGTCPVYQVTIFADGKVRYEGKNHVDQMGIYSGRIEKNAALALFSKIANFSWESYPEKYPIDNYDFPQFHLNYHTNSLDKTVKANSNAAKELIALGKEIDRLVAASRLVKD